MKLTLAVFTTIALAMPAFARDNIHVAGSSTVLPYATIVAEAFGENYSFPTPVVEGGGSGAGRKKLCEGVGEDTIDIANSSSKMKDSEYEDCAANGVTNVKEVRFGYDGIVFASDINGGKFALTPAIIYLAINKDSVIPSWDIVDASLPAQKISVLIPGTKHGTREVFDQKVLVQGCKDTGMYDEILAKVSDPKAAEKECAAVRNDGAVVEIDGDYTETLSRLDADKTAVGVFGLSFYENNTDKLQVATIDGVVPSVETISAGDYAISRPLFFYVKMQHLDIIPGLKEYVQFFLSDQMSGPDGELVQYGLVPDPELAATQAEWQ